MIRGAVFGLSLLLLANDTVAMSVRSPKCVQIFYDGNRHVGNQFGYGRRMALYLQNLLGHFKNVQQILSPVERYQKGQLAQCPYNFYIGSQFDNQLSAEFKEDVKTSPTSLVWMGYNAWQLGDQILQEQFGLQYAGIAEIDKNHLDADGMPGFYRLHEYKGEVFKKFASLNSSGTLEAVYDIVKMRIVNPKVTVPSWVKHSTLEDRVPYVTRNWNRWFIADVPFPYMNEEDRYLIFTDLLFDIIDEKPLRTERLAIARLEDVHPAIPEWQIKAFADMIKRQESSFILSLIPIFNDPYRVNSKPPEPSYLPMTKAPGFVKLLRELDASGVATIAMHGVTHQSDDQKNPDGVSGLDYEFWDIVANQPMPNDTAENLVTRLERGMKEITESGLQPSLWLTPHYAASILDTAIFGQLFDWNVGRIIYQPFAATQKERIPAHMRFTRAGSSLFTGQRLPYVADLQVELGKKEQMTEQFFPYEIYGDALGQRILPENAAYLIPKAGVAPSVPVDRVLSILKRNRVLRDYIGSFFIHPFLMNSVANGGLGEFNGDTKEIERLFSEARKMGYRFVSMKEWTAMNREGIRPEPIERK